MPPRSTSEIRQAYLDFFREKHDHAVIQGASLIPENDPTVLFTTAGMHPLVPYLLGEPHPSGKRLVDVQRCVRTQDIDEVGDSSHLTFFEMLGNWSLGDPSAPDGIGRAGYFKEGAIKMSYEFLTEVLELPHEKLAVSCFEGDQDAPKDEESAKIWKSLGFSSDRIVFLPKSENWWGPAGKTGPCGPDTEMFYWIGGGNAPAKFDPEDDRWFEIWNDVFMQYNKKDDGSFEPLSQKNVDTGMGLERTAAVMQGVDNVYEVDVMRPVYDEVLEVAEGTEGTEGKEVLKRHSRIITDHLRAAVFIMADGISPSNVDQGYVLRKLIRRAIRSGKQIGIEEEFCAGIAQEVIKQYSDAYSSLRENEGRITEELKKEEAQFGKTLREGLKHFEKSVEKLKGSEIDGVTAFHLYDTYGFPLELTKEMASEKGLSVDEDGFKKAFEEHQEKSRAGASQRFSGGLADQSSETTKLHTATHLLLAALRKVLGDHVFQKGSNITAERLRFDFSHGEKVTKEQLLEVEKLVSEVVKSDLPITYQVMSVDEAKACGAVGVFDERYGDEVKVYQVGDGSFSKEICGGPHVARTGMIGEFKIKKEESSSAGVRRIKAVVLGGAEKIEVAVESK